MRFQKRTTGAVLHLAHEKFQATDLTLGFAVGGTVVCVPKTLSPSTCIGILRRMLLLLLLIT